MRREGERLCIEGPVTLANVTRVLQEGYAQLRSGVRVVDLAAVSELDSSLLAALLAWLRDARGRDADLSFTNLPEGLTTIARLYGVADLLPHTAGGR